MHVSDLYENPYARNIVSVAYQEQHDSLNRVPRLTECARQALRYEDLLRSCWTPICLRTPLMESWKKFIDSHSVSIRSDFLSEKNISKDAFSLLYHQVLDDMDLPILIQQIHQLQINHKQLAEQGVVFFNPSVFELKRYSNLVFKIALDLYERDAISLRKRISQRAYIEEVIVHDQLQHVVLPQAQYIPYYAATGCCLLIEEKLPVVGKTIAQHVELWDYALCEPSIKRMLVPVLKDLILLICKTGLHDIKPENIPLLLNIPLSIGLVDIEMLGDPCKGISELISMLSPAFFDLVHKETSLHLPQQRLATIRFNELFCQRETGLKEDNLWKQFHIKHGIAPNDQVSLQSNSEISMEDQKLSQELLQLINAQIARTTQENGYYKRQISFDSKNCILRALNQDSVQRIEAVLAIFQQQQAIFSYHKQVMYDGAEYYIVKC